MIHRRDARTAHKVGLYERLPVPPKPSASPVEFDVSEIERSVAERLEKAWAGSGRSIAIRSPADSIAYEDLDAWAGGVARWLGAAGVRAGEGVALLLPDDVHAVAAMLGVIKAGACFIPLDPRSPVEYVAPLLKASGAKALLTIPASGSMTVELEPIVDRVGLIDGMEWQGGVKAAQAGPDSPLCLHFTSGSTGEPKGILQTHRVLLADIWRQTNDLQVSAWDRFGWVLPMTSTASLRTLFGALLSGAQLLPYDVHHWSFRDLAKYVRRSRTSILQTTPSLYRPIGQELMSLETPGDLRLLSLGMEPVLRQDFDLYRKSVGDYCVFQNTYGSTETRVISQCFLTKESWFEGERVPVGWTVWGKEVRIVDGEGKEAPPGTEGEIVVRSRYLPSGYWLKSPRTEGKFRGVPSEPELRDFFTGDRGSRGADGMLRVLGRRDSEVKIRGNRVDLEALEARLLTHPSIRAVATGIHKDESQREAIAAFIVLENDATMGMERIRRYVAEALPSYMIPRFVCFLEELPVSPTGKLDRKALPHPRVVKFPEGGATRPLTAMETRLAKIWEDTLGVATVPPDVSFFDLGGDSILAASLVQEIEEQLGVKFTPRILYEYGTLEKLAANLQEAGSAESEGRLVYLNRSGTRRPLYLLPGRGGGSLAFQHLTRLLGADQPMIAIEYQGTNGLERPARTIEEMAESAVAQLRAGGAKGPFRLAGSSIGGVVALEVARQLVADGDDVEFVMLFDTSAPMPASEKGTGAGVPSIMQRAMDPTARETWMEQIRDDLTYLFRRFRRGGVPSPVKRRRHIRKFSRAFVAYRPGPVPVRLILFRAWGYGHSREPNESDRRWERLTTVGLEICHVRGGHSLVREPHVQQLSAAMAPYLAPKTS